MNIAQGLPNDVFEDMNKSASKSSGLGQNEDDGQPDREDGLAYSPAEGLVLTLDQAYGIPKQFKEVRVVYSEFKGHIAYGEAAVAGPGKVGPDKWGGNKENMRSTFATKKLFKEV